MGMKLHRFSVQFQPQWWLRGPDSIDMIWVSSEIIFDFTSSGDSHYVTLQLYLLDCMIAILVNSV
jgi:hypothetical protein